MSRASPRYHRNNPHLPPVGIANNIVMYKLKGTVENQITISTFCYEGPNANPSSGQLTTLLTAISTNLLAAFKACVSSAWAVVDEELNVISRADINGVYTIANAGGLGTRGAPALPTTSAIVIDRQSATKGQHGRGRLSLPAVPAADVTSSNVTAAALKTNLAALCTAMKVTASDGVNTWTPCIAERSPTSPGLAIGFGWLTTTAYDTLLGTIRRRKIGRGI